MTRTAYICGMLAIACMLTGCATTQQAAVTDTFCLTAQKRSWSINDSAESIRSAEAWNAAIDRKCGVKQS